MNDNRKFHVFVLRTAAVLLILVMLSTAIVSGRFARYVTQASGEDSACVAMFAFDVTKQDGQAWVLDLDDLQKPGDQQKFTFSVRNTMGNAVSEVNVGYTVYVHAQGSIPVTVTILEGTNERLSITCDGNESQSFTGSDFAAATETVHTYTLVVEWPEDKNGMEYAEGQRILVLTISVKGEQKD